MSRGDARADRTVALLEATARELLRYFERRVGADDAADALSETMVIVWRRSASIPPTDADARLWMFGVARNVVLNVRRSHRRRVLLTERIRGAFDVSDAVAPPADEGLDVRAALERLDPDLAELVRLVHWDGFAISEAAQILGLPASTARSRYQRAKRELGALLAVASGR